MRINLTTPMSGDEERERRTKAVLDAIEQYTEMKMNEADTNGDRSGGQPVLKPCGHCGEQCADLIIDQGDKWAHYSASCLAVRTGYNLSSDAPWRAEAIAAYNKRQPTQSDALQADIDAMKSILWVDTIIDDQEAIAKAFARHRQYGYDQGYYDGSRDKPERADQ